jgi:hypothetical protein
MVCRSLKQKVTQKEKKEHGRKMWSGQRSARGLLAEPTTRQVMAHIRNFMYQGYKSRKNCKPSCIVRMYSHTIVYFYIRIPKIWEMSARADINCHDILNFVSATRTHLAKIGATRCVVADMSRHVGNISS